MQGMLPRMLRQGDFIKRWPQNPKILFFAAPNIPKWELSQRLAVDLGVPVLNVVQMLKLI